MSLDSKDVRPTAQTPAPRRPKLQGVRTYVLLIFAMVLVTLIVTSLSLLLIRHRLRDQIATDLSQDLNHSVITFNNLESERLIALERENALLAELPTLKALMTSGDDLTIQDGAMEFWQLSGDDLFALADSGGRIVSVYTNNASPDPTLRESLQTLLTTHGKHYLIHGKRLYACSLRPLYFGTQADGTLLGYVISGISIERTVRQISQPTGVEAMFLSDNRIVASTLSMAEEANFSSDPRLLAGALHTPSTVMLGTTRFLAATEDLSDTATSPLQLVVLKSFQPAELWIARIDRMILSAGLLALLAGTIFMIVLSRLLTHPLEELSDSVRAFGMGDGDHRIPRYGTQEVRQLSTAFASMRDEIQLANRALLESERLATIGRMASSVSHDLRHYLAAVYANAEFLASGRLTTAESAEVFADIRAAVHGTTDMIESLLVFSRTGASVRRSPELMPSILEGAIALVRVHPDAEGVKFTTDFSDPSEAPVVVEAKQIERAIYNLLLNACQAARTAAIEPVVSVSLEIGERYLMVKVVDNGGGVPEGIRDSLLEPFVSEGKQKGTGLGLTLAHCIAVEHGGSVDLISSRYGQTIFQMKVARNLRIEQPLPSPEVKSKGEVVAHENIWT